MVDEESAQTATCPGCGVPLYSQSELGDAVETRPSYAHPTPQDIEITRQWEPAAHDVLPTPDQLPRVIGRYKLTHLLGEGGFAHVYRAVDSELEREVALKIPRRDRFSTYEKLSLFLDEAKFAAKLEHPGIVRIYDVGWMSDKICFISMEMCTGGSLESLIKSETRIDPHRAAQLMAQLADAAHFAHLKGLVHRDLKPSNVMLGGDGNCRIVDFALAMHDDVQLEHAGEVAGTLPYMSPEQIRGEVHHLDGRSDIWSLGVILYQMLTGRRPFLGHREQLVEQILKREPKPPRQLVEGIPSELERICLRCLSKPISGRWKTARDLASALRAWHAASPLGAIEPPSSVALVGTSRSIGRWKTAASAIAVSAVAVSLLAFALQPAKKGEEERLAAIAPARTELRAWSFDDQAPFRQFPLLTRSPRRLAWPIPGRAASLDHDADEAKLSINSKSLTLVELGQTQATEFRLDAELFKSANAGSSGLFWGYQSDSTHPKRSSCFAVFLKCFAGVKSQPSFHVVASYLEFIEAPSGEISMCTQVDIVSDPVEPPQARGDQLECSVNRFGFGEVMWNRQSLTRILNAASKWASEDKAESRKWRTAGHYGVMNMMGSTLVRNAHFTLLKEGF